MRYIGNAISLGMIDIRHCLLAVEQITDGLARGFVISGPWESCVGHADIAELLTEMLGVPVPLRRVTTSLVIGDELLVAQYTGPRLPEGARCLPVDAKLRWYHVKVLAVPHADITDHDGPGTHCGCGECGIREGGYGCGGSTRFGTGDCTCDCSGCSG